MSRAAQVGIVMGSDSDWSVMEHAARTLQDFGVSWIAEIAGAHSSLDMLRDFAGPAREKGMKAIITGAGGAAHLAGVTAKITDIPVLAVPIDSTSLIGLDALLSMVQMPGGIPVATFAIGKAGAVNAALFAVAMIANEDPAMAQKLAAFRKNQSDKVKAAKLPPLDPQD